jgi:amidase
MRDSLSRPLLHAVAVLLVLATPGLAQTPIAATRTAFDPTERSIPELQAALASGRTTSVALTDAYLARIAAYDHAGPSLNAMIRVNGAARHDAAVLDAERKAGRLRGPLHGIPIVLKDNYDTKDIPTTGGSLALANHQPTADAFIVNKLRAAGAVILGKTNLHELASGVTSISSMGGQTLNPYDLSRCPGGSSGGTGAAVAASFAAVGWGTDTCGSIRIPSAFGSLFGLRPTLGLMSRDGIIPLALSQDVAGPMARTATDLAIALDVTVGADPRDTITRRLDGRPLPRFEASLRKDALRGARIGIFTPYFRTADADVADTVRAAARAMRALGAEVVDVAMPDFDDVIGSTSAITLETRFDLQEYFARPGDRAVGSLGQILENGLFDKALEARHRSADTASARDSESHRRVMARQAALRTRIVALMDSLHLDALAYPTSVRKPVLAGDPQLGATCALAAQTGLPALSIPAGFTADGLPTGLELMGRAFSDAQLVSYGFAFEQAGPRRRPPPTTPALVNGKAPTPMRGRVTVGPEQQQVTVSFVFDPLTSELRYRAQLRGAKRGNVSAVVLRRYDAGTGGRELGQGRVLKRLLGPGMASGSGSARLLGDDLDAFRAGRLRVSLFGSAATVTPVAETVIGP